MRRVLFRHVGKQLHRLFQKHLEFTRDHLEFRDHKDPDNNGKNDQHARNNKGRDHRRIDFDQPEQIDLVTLMKNAVLHDHADLLMSTALCHPCENDPDDQRHKDHGKNDNKSC